MGQLLGIGTTHSPPLALPNTGSATMFKQALFAPIAGPRSRTTAALEAAGRHEVLNRTLLAGTMDERDANR